MRCKSRRTKIGATKKGFSTQTPNKLIMFFVYILKSQKDGKRYIGSTNNINKRVKEHNSGLVTSTKSRRPFKLVYCECYLSEKDARDREENLKLRGRALTILVRRIKRSLAS